MAGLASRFAKLSPFGSSKDPADDDDVGESTDLSSMAGGGHTARETQLTHQLRVGQALRSFLVRENVLTEAQAGFENPDELSDPLRSLLDRPHVQVPPKLTDRSYPLPDYFVSSSHNTYLSAHQLYGSSTADSYKATLRAGARCVEIDAWDGSDEDEPKVTHGYTLTSNIPFRSVCETIRDVVDEETLQQEDVPGYRAAPILLSLENHCGAHGQKRLADIMKEVFGHRLLSKAVRDKGTEEQQGTGGHITLAELENKIAVIVEYHFPGEPEDDDDDSDSSSDEDEEQKRARKDYKEKKQTAPATVIVPELAELGVYAQSVKPPNNAWFEVGILQNSPHHPLINVSETGLAAHMPAHNSKIVDHNAEHLMRVYPKGTRISSDNLHPVIYWGIGAQVCALNWQTFGASMQLNEALFSGTDGYVLKPKSLRQGGTLAVDYRRKKLRLHVAGASGIPIPGTRNVDDLKPYLTCTLVHPTEPETKKKTSPYKQHKLNLFRKEESPLPSDPLWDEVLEWEYPDNDLTFLRLLIKSDDSFAQNPIFVVSAVRLLYVQQGWVFIRMLDLKGHETKCCLLVKFEIIDVDEHA
ncbi:hypothetical protein LTS08_004321 [Lithohypha guttulata]|nr:hypothetical protein LTS08_004321 [Lithohypha guttulata]